METVSISNSVANERNRQLNNVVREQSPKLLNFIRKQIDDANDAEDILQDVLSGFSLQFMADDPINSVTGWLYRAARNRIVDVFRRKKTTSFSDLESDSDDNSFLNSIFSEGESPEDELWNAEISTAIRTALDQLPAEQKEVFILHEIEGLPYSEISELTGETISALTSRKRYAIGRLQMLLTDLYDDLNTDN